MALSLLSALPARVWVTSTPEVRTRERAISAVAITSHTCAWAGRMLCCARSLHCRCPSYPFASVSQAGKRKQPYRGDCSGSSDSHATAADDAAAAADSLREELAAACEAALACALPAGSGSVRSAALPADGTSRLLMFNLFALEGFHLAEALAVPCLAVSPCLVPYAPPAGFERRFAVAHPALYPRLRAADEQTQSGCRAIWQRVAVQRAAPQWQWHAACAFGMRCGGARTAHALIRLPASSPYARRLRQRRRHRCCQRGLARRAALAVAAVHRAVGPLAAPPPGPARCALRRLPVQRAAATAAAAPVL